MSHRPGAPARRAGPQRRLCGRGGPASARPGHAPVPGIPDPRAAQSVTLVVGFDDSEPARRALIWGADLLRTRPGALHVIYADHVLIDSDLSGFGRTEMDEARDEKAASVAEAANADFRAATSAPLCLDWVLLLPGVLPGLRSFFQGRYRRWTWPG